MAVNYFMYSLQHERHAENNSFARAIQVAAAATGEITAFQLHTATPLSLPTIVIFPRLQSFVLMINEDIAAVSAFSFRVCAFVLFIFISTRHPLLLT
jgi:hypothetical protein